jgi:hypothetical protein
MEGSGTGDVYDRYATGTHHEGAHHMPGAILGTGKPLTNGPCPPHKVVKRWYLTCFSDDRIIRRLEVHDRILQLGNYPQAEGTRPVFAEDRG